ncbi:MAG: DUF1761 domain-containing protein [Patescibacteria group bacterium]
MEFSWIAVIVASIAMFVVGAIWYMPLFGKMWGEMFGFDKLDKKTQAKMQKEMGPYYALQMGVTFLTAAVLTKLVVLLPNYSAYTLAFLLWLGLIFPTQVSAVIFGGTEVKWIKRRILIMAGGSLLPLLAAAFVISKIV